ncbi:hypothetical protein SYN63AY4M2_04725 [Synechococcus sp. 63AY4M2]|jgi:hypothetical protein|nr:hypothetical protein SYN63AY4M2_04725 [Synechococcus sp. 63AY4M2]PIK89780.1 hypothetical protein SYN65AY6A5_08530 [Synechococcus sp. 65AY6A5]PIK96415.1 hypothetical protein SYN60AY4M2_05280 [Synechococcus sp. 60AY4M2]PIK99011.1 hypothetical protein SYN63AY4M1_02730 [Synechococcus sp. 63AY4M1]PIL02542.1 hypothetical protein SYN65AY640_11380 [Synechococcus sp. 65AY640]
MLTSNLNPNLDLGQPLAVFLQGLNWDNRPSVQTFFSSEVLPEFGASLLLAQSVFLPAAIGRASACAQSCRQRIPLPLRILPLCLAELCFSPAWPQLRPCFLEPLDLLTRIAFFKETSPMNDLRPWPERIADREGDYLTPDDLQDLIRYALSFPERLDLYQVLQQQERAWIEQVLQQHGYTGGAESSLTPAQRLLARQLAFCLRSLGLSLLLGDPTPLQQGTLGAMEQYLGLPQALDQLGAVVQGSLSAEQWELLAPYWQLLRATGDPSSAPLPKAKAEGASEPAPTLMEMFA